LDSHFSDYSPRLTEDWMKNLKEDCYVFTGITRPFLKELCEKANVKLIPLFDRDDVAIYNSIQTVEGALMMAIQYTDITIQHSNVFVTSFGRVRTKIAKTFASLVADVKVVARKKDDLAIIFERGFEPFHLD